MKGTHIMSPCIETSAHLISRIRDGKDTSAWGRFVYVYEPLVLSVCRKHGLQQADAADLVQDVFAAVARAMPRFSYDAARGSFRSWLVKVTRSKLATHFQKRCRRVATVTSESVGRLAHCEERPEIERDESLDERWSLFDRVRNEIRPEFRPKTWTAFWLTAMQGFTNEDVAEYLGISVQAVYIAKSRVLKRLRARVQEQTADD
jgi:RNA polymerase sigma-70 factor (ECF subfamily)